MKTWVFQERIITFPWNQKIVELGLKYISRNYYNLAEITLNQFNIPILDLAWNSVIYGIALPCKDVCNVTLKCLFLKVIFLFLFLLVW